MSNACASAPCRLHPSGPAGPRDDLLARFLRLTIPAMGLIADLCYFFAALLYSPFLLFRILVTGKNRAGWSGRLGSGPPFDPLRKRIWIHAVSVGEMNATRALVADLEKALPGVDLVFSATTDTGFARGVELYGPERVFRFPLDFSRVVDRVLNRVRPAMIVLMELEVWYNLTRRAHRRGVPVVVVNGRLTARSLKRFRRFAALVRPMFADLTWVAAQDEAIADRFHVLGVPKDRISITSSLKWDSAEVTERIHGDQALASDLGIEPFAPLWVCGSTGPGEEAMILNAHQRLIDARQDVARELQGLDGGARRPPIRLAIVPRKPERFDEVARLIEARGWRCIRRSEHPDGTEVPSGGTTSVILGDTMGELRKFYSLASIVFIGRSLVPLGGSDVMEAAALGKPVLVGPHMDNFRDAVDSLTAVDAVRVVNSEAVLSAELIRLFADAERRIEMGNRARELVRRKQGATRRTVEIIVNILEARPDSASAGVEFPADTVHDTRTSQRPRGSSATARR